MSPSGDFYHRKDVLAAAMGARFPARPLSNAVRTPLQLKIVWGIYTIQPALKGLLALFTLLTPIGTDFFTNLSLHETNQMSNTSPKVLTLPSVLKGENRKDVLVICIIDGDCYNRENVVVTYW